MDTKYIKFHISPKNKNILLDAPHAKSPGADKFTGEIAQKIAQKIEGSYMVSLVSRRTEADLNRGYEYPLPLQKQARTEYIETIKLIKSKVKTPLLHIALHGMRDEHGYDFIIGTRYGRICNKELAKKLKKLLEREFKKHNLNPIIVIDKLYPGDPSLETLKDKIGKDYQIIQLEISRKYREKYQSITIEVLANVINGLFKLNKEGNLK